MIFNCVSVNRWLSARFNLLSAAVVGATGFVAILTPGISASTAGFALAFASTISNDVRPWPSLLVAKLTLLLVVVHGKMRSHSTQYTAILSYTRFVGLLDWSNLWYVVKPAFEKRLAESHP